MLSQGFVGLLKLLISRIGSKRSSKNTALKLPEITPADIKEAIEKGAANTALDWEDEDLLDINGW